MKVKCFVIMAMSLLVIVSCEYESPKEKKESARAKDLHQKISQLVKQHNADAEWDRYFREQDFGTENFTAHFERIFLSDENNPFLFVAEIVDVKKQGSKFVISASVGDHWPNYDCMFVLLQCAPRLTEAVLQRRHDFSDGNTYILVATVSTVERPPFRLESVEITDEESGFITESYAHLEFFASDIIILTGTCMDVVFVGNYRYSDIEWWKDDWLDVKTENTIN